MSNKAVCIHGHFYQPAREDPISGMIAREDGAYPYRNWNERILDQCYRPNAEWGNFEQISFDLGPTLINWMISNDPATLSKIISQERRTFSKYGVGNGMALPYHHTILPLAKPHDKITQVTWGIADFEYRFAHKPAGLWLPEAAVDEATLELLVDQSIQFTILAPWQAAEYNLDVSQPYWVELGSGRRIAVFFYQEDLSMRISFDPGATSNGDRFIRDYLTPKFSFNGHRADKELMLIASDGELYGHHQQFRDKFLSYITQWKDNSPNPIDVTFPGLWLQQNPPEKTIKLRYNTSWSCHHGVARWKEACPCTPNGDWKARLRGAIDGIAETIDEQYLTAVQPYLNDPWELLYRYIDILHGKMSFSAWLQDVLGRRLEETEVTKIDLLLRAQVQKQRMYTSCGWFFEDFDRLEPRIVVTAAAYAVWWVKLACGVDLVSMARELLSGVRSWRTGINGETVFMGQINRLRYEQLPLPFTQSEPVHAGAVV